MVELAIALVGALGVSIPAYFSYLSWKERSRSKVEKQRILAEMAQPTMAPLLHGAKSEASADGPIFAALEAQARAMEALSQANLALMGRRADSEASREPEQADQKEGAEQQADQKEGAEQQAAQKEGAEQQAAQKEGAEQQAAQKEGAEEEAPGNVLGGGRREKSTNERRVSGVAKMRAPHGNPPEEEAEELEVEAYARRRRSGK